MDNTETSAQGIEIPADIYDYTPQEPGQGEQPPAQTQPEVVHIRVNGKTYQMTTDLADAFNEQMQLATRKVHEGDAEKHQLRTENNLLRNQLTQRTPPPTASESNPQQDLDFFANPTNFAQTLIKQALTEAEQRVEERVNNRLQANENERLWWEKLHQDYPHLIGKEKLVRAMLAADFDHYRTLDPMETQRQVVEALHKELGIASTSPGSNKRTLNQTQVSSDRVVGTPPPRQQRQEQQQTTELTPDWGLEAINQRKQARLKASQSKELARPSGGRR